MTRKNRRKQKHTAHCFVFTIETLTLTQKALELFEQPLERADHHNEKVAFAEETMQQVKGKLAAMKQSVGLLCVTAFDYNEKVIITEAIWLYVLDLSLSHLFHPHGPVFAPTASCFRASMVGASVWAASCIQFVSVPSENWQENTSKKTSPMRSIGSS
jgi:hypothetical protein